MVPSRGKCVTIAVASLGFAGAAAAGLALQGWIAEEYCLWRLERGDLAERRLAAESLADMGTLRGIRALIVKRRGPSGNLFEAALRRLGPRAAPQLLQIIVDDYDPQSKSVWCGSCWRPWRGALDLLRETAPEIHEALLRRQDRDLRVAAAEALREIGRR